MVTDIPNQDALLPDRHPQRELFICDVTDAVLKDDMASMEHPVFSLSKKPDLNVRRYEHGDNWLEITPSAKGLATIYDKDILIYAISQLMDAKKRGNVISKLIEISARDLLIFTNRYTGGRDYELLKDALVRLRGTTLATNVKTGSETPTKIFGLIEEATVHRDPKTRRVTKLEICLSDWLYKAVGANEVLTLHRDYFRLRKPLERRVYEIARKHCGSQAEWSVALDLLRKKCGSKSPVKHFRYLVRDLVQRDYLPDYQVSFDDDKDRVTFRNREILAEIVAATGDIRLDPETYHDARTSAPDWDVRYLENQWRAWMVDGGLEAPSDPDKAFLGFCRKWYEKRGAPA